MKRYYIHFYVGLVTVFLPVICRGKFLGLRASHKQEIAVDAMPAHNSTLAAQPVRNASRVDSAAASEHVPRGPRVYFLFLAVDKIANFAVWKAFFKDAFPGSYRALIHCKGPICMNFATQAGLFVVVPTVQAEYCTDLVSPMNQLLAGAVLDDPASANPNDKFVFVSDSTLPAKPFWHVYNTLTTRSGSDLCMFPSKDWADAPTQLFEHGKPVQGHELAIKTHQWMVLSRHHSERAVHSWNQGVMKNMMTNFHMNTGGPWQSLSNRTFGDNRNYGCLDEYWHMSVLFGPWKIADSKGSTEYQYPDLTNAPVRINANTGWQGACDTFALWSEYTSASYDVPSIAGKPSVSPFVKLYSSLDAASMPHVSDNTRPAWWDTISRHGIQAIRNSDFLFVRKFIDNPTLAYGGDFSTEYSRLVFT